MPRIGNRLVCPRKALGLTPFGVSCAARLVEFVLRSSEDHAYFEGWVRLFHGSHLAPVGGSEVSLRFDDDAVGQHVISEVAAV